MLFSILCDEKKSKTKLQMINSTLLSWSHLLDAQANVKCIIKVIIS